MPTLDQKLNGDYFVRAHGPSKDSVVTYQVSPKGVSFLAQYGIHSGREFPKSLLFTLIEQNLIFTSGTGMKEKVRTPFRQVLVKEATLVKETDEMSLPVTKNVNSILLSIEKRNKGWKLMINFPEITTGRLENYSRELITKHLELCGLQIDGTKQMIKGTQLLPGKGGASLNITPKESKYTLTTIGLWPPYARLKGKEAEISGLNPSGTLFNRDDGLRLREKGAMVLGKSYFMIFLNEYKFRQTKLPISIKVHTLGLRGNWEVWEINLPNIIDLSTLDWCLRLGHPCV
jgi:hypothetical protein